MQYATSNDVPIDFLSTHLYPSDPNLPLQRNVFEALVGNASKLGVFVRFRGEACRLSAVVRVG